MSKRNKVWIVLITLILLVIVSCSWALTMIPNINLTQEQIKNEIDKKLPLTTKDVTFTDAEVFLHQGSIRIAFQAETTKFGKKGNLDMSIEGELDYDPIAGSFYFVPYDIQITTLGVDGKTISEKTTEVVDAIKKQEKVNKFLGSISKFAKERDIKIPATAVMGKVVQEKATAGLTKAVGRALEKIPVYTFKNNIKENIAKMLLASVEVQEGVLIARLTFPQLLKNIRVFLIIFVITIAFGIALYRNPEWGIVLDVVELATATFDV
ncbi:hypothetical protein COB55_01375 [Candidatus Wolfebacteria bacterium]|nr:MAG: hypothetical protein COB55_01375 [Candidatus Wolfebacteria bacterium]